MARRSWLGRCFYGAGGLILLYVVVDQALELNYRRTPNQMAILSAAVGSGYSCPQASVRQGMWNGPSIFKAGDFADDVRITLPQTCIERLDRAVKANHSFRFENCSFADVCWTDYGRTARRSFVELHFLKGEIIFRHIRA